jgi:voltage-gated potassium channel
VPVTPLGKMLGGVVMVLGVCMIALPVAIIATGFSLETNRHQFVVTWSMVSQVPLFATMNEAEVAEITKLLYTRTYMPGVPIVRAGDAGGSMFLIESGEACVEFGLGRRKLLKQGDFFGEMALLEHCKHKHDVIATTRCRLYVLDSQALARLARRHPEIMQHIREVADQRARAEGEKLAGTRPRKPHATAAKDKASDLETL